MPSRQELANAIRFLSIDAVQKANSGHPGMPMGMADIATELWLDFLNFNPVNPKWPNRDRFLLSNGHGSMLQYSLLHLTGYDLSLDDLKNFRQLHSKTAGHPEVDEVPGVETTTGPLGQGLANAVGMALAEKILATQFNRDQFNVVDHHTYAFAGDGCLMEGVSHEVCSLAGTWKLGKLIVFWDDNNISIDGDTKNWFTDDVAKRFESYQWHVIPKVDGFDQDAIKAAIIEAKNVTDKPTLICCQTVIGHGSPNKAGKSSSHGSPLGDDEVALTRKELNWDHAPFEIPKEISEAFDSKAKGAGIEKIWQEKWQAYEKEFPELAQELKRRWSNALPENWSLTVEKLMNEFLASDEKMATRKASQKVLDIIGPTLSELIGGSADLTPSTLTDWKGCKSLTPENFDANYIHYGVREFGMSAIMNGLVLYGGFIPFGGTFLVFYSYAANAVRMAALMKKQSIFVYTHDSIGLGEDGPTHQPIEQIDQLRSLPNCSVWRPCDSLETAVAWQAAIEKRDAPTALLLSRQGLPVQNHDKSQISDIKRGGYVLVDCEETPKSIIIATGSEVALAVEAAEKLSVKGHAVRVVSMPSTDVFLSQDQAYRDTVLPPEITARVAVEAGSTDFWYRFVGTQGCVIGLDRFGLSAPATDVQQTLGLTVEHIVGAVKALL